MKNPRKIDPVEGTTVAGTLESIDRNLGRIADALEAMVPPKLTLAEHVLVDLSQSEIDELLKPAGTE